MCVVTVSRLRLTCVRPLQVEAVHRARMLVLVLLREQVLHPAALSMR